MADDRCPTGETLAAFSLGLLADEEVDAIAAHLDSCGRCEAAILGLEGAPGRPLQAPRGGGGPGMGLFDELLGKYEPGRRVGGPPPMRWPDAEETAWGPSGGLRAAGRSTGAERPADAPGGLRLGDFRLLREVGRGGMGVVFEAIQESLGRRVALKVLRGSIKADPLALQRFRREAQAAARLHHTNIVAVFGVGEEGGSPYYVMQFIDGPGLDRVVQEMRRGRAATGPGPSTETVASGPGPGTPGSRRGRTGGVARSTPTGTLPPLEATAVAGEGAEAPRGGPAPRPGPPASLPGWMSSAGARGRDTWRAIAEIGAQVADALHHAHEHRTLHRDIKPSNILLDDEGTPWLADFGLAKAAEQDDVTQTGDIVGTIRYMAPERFRGQCDHRSDIYSLGLTLYELIALRPAFDQAERNDLIFQVTEGEAPRLRGLAPEVPRDLELIVHKAIERAPAHRYRAAGEVADDLRRFLDGRPIRARRVGPAEQFARWCRRNPWVSGLTAAVFALLLAIAWGASWAAIEIAAKAANLEVARRELDRSLYMARMNSAPLAGETANMPQLRELLDPYLRPTSAGDLRGFEWYYWWRFALPASRGLGRNERPIGRLAFSHDGGMVASGTEDGSIGLWPTSGAGRPIVFKAHPSVILGLAFSPDGPDLATGDDRSIRLWDGRTGLLKKTLAVPEHTSLATLGFRDGRSLVAIYGDNSTQRWDTRTWESGGLITGEALADPSKALGYDNPWALSPECRLVACGLADGDVVVRRVDEGGPPIRIGGRRSLPRSLAISGPDAAGLAPRVAVGYEDKSIMVYDVGTGLPVAGPLEGHTSTPWSLAFSPSADRLASGGLDNRLMLWDLKAGALLETMRGHTNSIMAVAFSRSGGAIASAGSDSQVNLWDASGRSPRDVLRGHDGPVDAVTFSRDGSTLFSASRDTTLRAWRVSDGAALGPFRGSQHAGQIRALQGTRDGKSLISAGWDDRIKTWDIASGTLASEFLGHPDRPDTALNSLALSPDGRTLAYAGQGRILTIYDLQEGKSLARLPLKHDTPALAFSPDGRLLVATDMATRAVKILDARDGRPEGPPLEGRTLGSESLAFSRDGKLLAVGHGDGTISVWRMDARALLSSPGKHSNSVCGLSFSPDGRTLASGGRDNLIKLWDVASGEPKTTLRGHSSNVLDLAFSPDGQTLASASIDRTVRLWRSSDPRDVPASGAAPR